MLLIPTLLCPKSWEQMSGTDTQRFCTHCRQAVHNLDALSVSERLALLASPAAKLCTRYKVAIRRPARGRQESYARHLLKYGAAVAITSGALLTIWEVSVEGDQQRRYRVFTGTSSSLYSVPADDYCETEVYILGMQIAVPSEAPPTPACGLPTVPAHIDVQIDPLQIDRLFDQAKPTPPAFEFTLPAKLPPQ